MKSMFIRVSDIFTANIHAMIDEAEDPEVMIRQIVREMESNLHEAKKDVADAITAEKRLERQLDIHRVAAEKWQRRAETSLKAGNEGLAREALMRRTEQQDTATAMANNLDAARQASETLRDQLKRMCRKLEEARESAISLKARQRSAQAQMRISSSLDSFEKAHVIHQKFDQMSSKVMDMEARAQALAELGKDGAGSCRRYDVMEMDIAVKSQLEALKQKISTTESH